MAYSDITFADKNRIKRFLQEQRLVTALNIARQQAQKPQTICDFGGGNGELCKLLSEEFQSSTLYCYEPAPDLHAEAKSNIGDIEQVTLLSDSNEIPDASVDMLFCLEVFEHLPPAETQTALAEFKRIMKPEGVVVVGVPVEVGLPALYKGLFRMVRRYGAFDANIAHVLASTFGCPPVDRPESEIGPGLKYYNEHVGFDHRRLRKQLKQEFSVQYSVTSPCKFFCAFLMPEIYFVMTKQGEIV